MIAEKKVALDQNEVKAASTKNHERRRFNLPDANEMMRTSRNYTTNVDQFVTIGDIFNSANEEKKKLQKLLSGIEPNWRVMRAGTIKNACKKFLKDNKGSDSPDMIAASAIWDTMKLIDENDPLHINPQVLNNMRFIIEAYGITEESLFVASLCEF